MINIQTPTGDKSIFHLSYGDNVYNIHGNLSRVIGDKYHNNILLYRLHYSDGRSSIHCLDDILYTKKGKIPIRQLIHKFVPYEVFLSEIKYKDKLKMPMHPDPYISGALLIYGDFAQENVNLPLKLTGANPYFTNKYHVEHASIMVNDLVMFQKINTDKIITWKEFFNDKLDHDFYVNNILPLYIRRSSVNDRYQFIRGAFDLGYDSEIFMESECGIGHKNPRKLEMVQKILWSLGLNSSIEKYTTPNRFGWTYRLKVNERMEKFSSLFYHIRKMEKMIVNRTTVIKYPMPVSKLTLSEITIEKEDRYRELILDKPSIIIDENFLPRISL